MPKFILTALATGITSLALLGAAHAASNPVTTSMDVAQAQVPEKCAAIKDPAQRKKCLEDQKGR
jgi:hypothetical protein